MVATDKVFSGSIPEIYQQFLVPLIFEPFARDMAERVAKLAPRALLETAAGTGVVTRALAARLPASTRIVATDLNPPMLEQAKVRQAGKRPIEWKQADALALPFKEQSFDAVICQFGAMFFPDRVKGYREARRVLRDGGHFIFNVWDRICDNDFADTITEALATMFPDDPPRFLARTPHGYHDADQIRADLKAAGFAKASVEPVDARSKAPSARDAAIAYCQGTPLTTELLARDASRIEEATTKAAEAVARRFGQGAVDGRIRALVVTVQRRPRCSAASTISCVSLPATDCLNSPTTRAQP